MAKPPLLSGLDFMSMGTPVPTESPVVSAKKALLEQTALQKMAVYGSPAEQRTIATAVMQGNDAGQDPGVRDIIELDPVQYVAKYGQEAYDARHAFAKAYSRLGDLKDSERTPGQMAGDAAIDVGVGAVNLVGGVTALGAELIEQPIQAVSTLTGGGNVAPISPYVTMGMQWAGDQLHGQQSEVLQARREQHAIESQLMAEDRERSYQANLAENADADSVWDRAVAPWINKQAGTVGDVISNYAEDPMMMGSLAAEGVGSLLPVTAAAKGLGMVRATSKLVSGGMTEAAAASYLKTPAGRAMLVKETEKAVPLIIGASEGGAGVTQAQQQILALTDEELQGSERYADLKEEGLSDDQIRMRLASDAGAVAGAVAIPIGMAAGKMVAPFTARPLASASGPVSAVGNVIKETAEEFIQGGNTQVAANVAMNVAAGIETNLDQGVAESATAEALGGALSAAGLQTPGAVLGTGAAAVEAVAKGVKAAVTARQDSIATGIDNASPVGQLAQATAVSSALENATTLLGALDEADTAVSVGTDATPEQTEAVDRRQVVREKLTNGLFLDDETAQAYVNKFPALGNRLVDNKLPRMALIEAGDAVLQTEAVPRPEKIEQALGMLSTFDAVRQIESDEALAVVEDFDEGSLERQIYEKIQADVATMKSSKALDRARKMVGSLTKEEVDQFPFKALLDGGTDEQKTEVRKLVATIARVNPEVVSDLMYKTVLNQVDGTTEPDVKADIELGQAVAAEIAKADAARDELSADTDEVIENNDGTTTKKPNAPKMYGVRDDIRITSNRNNDLPSLLKHYSLVMEALKGGNVIEAEGYLEDLGKFAKHQINKIGAYNKSAQMGGGIENKVTFEGYSQYDGTYGTTEGVYAGSMALMRAVMADTESAVNIYNALAARIEKDPIGAKQVRLKVPTFSDALERSVNNSYKVNPRAAKQAERVKAKEATAAEAAKAKADAEAAEAAETKKAEAAAKKRASAKKRREAKKVAAEDARVVEAEVVQEPKPEPQTEGVEETVEVAEPTSKTWFEGLKTTLFRAEEGMNYFLQAFRPKASDFSTLTGKEFPGRFVVQNLSQLKTSTNGVKRELTVPEQKALKDLILSKDYGLAGFSEKLNARLIERASDKGKNNDVDSWFERLEKDADVPGFDNGLILNTLVRKEDGTDVLEPRIVAALYMATTEWLLQNLGKGRPKVSNEDVLKLFGLPRGTQITGDMRKVAQFGTSHQLVAEEISTKMMTLLGLSVNKDVTGTYTQGVMKSLAANGMEFLLDGGLIEVSGPGASVWASTMKNQKTGRPVALGTALVLPDGSDDRRVMMRASVKAKDTTSLEAMAKVRDPFSQIFTENEEAQRHVGTAPKRVKDTQLGNEFALISPLGRRVLKDRNTTPSFVNVPFYNFIQAVGTQNWKALMGYVEIPEDAEQRFNKMHLESILGKNQSLDHEISEVEGYVFEAETFGLETGQALEEIEVFFDHALSSVGRAQQQGPVTPQGSKFARELLSTTTSEIDLDDAQHMEFFWLAVAQSVGLKVEKEPHYPRKFAREKGLKAETKKGIIPDVKAKFNPRRPKDGLQPAVLMAREFLKTGKIDGDAFRDLIWEAVADDTVGEVTDKLMHAVFAVAQMQEAQLTKNRKKTTKFKTALALEADGKTDGPINAMIHMGLGHYNNAKLGDLEAGAFSAAEVERFALGGLFFTSQKVSLNDFIEASYRESRSMGIKPKWGEDLYHKGAKIFEAKLNEARDKTDKTQGDVMTLLSAFLPEYTAYKEVPRGVVKNPLTVFLYGSGVNGIAGKIAGEVMGEIYMKLSQTMGAKQDGEINPQAMEPHVLQALKDLTGMDPTGNPGDFELTSTAWKNLVKAIEVYFAEPMSEAIDEATGSLSEVMRFTQQVSSIQTAVFQEVLDRRMAAKLEERIASGALKKGQLLSEKDMAEVFTDTMSIAPIYGDESGGESFQISKPKKTPGKQSVSSSLQGRFSVKGRTLTGADASVKISPYLTIGMGDGRMILNIYANEDGSLRSTLAVFDGVEQNIADAARSAPLINKAVFEGWTGQNTFKTIENGFWQMISSLGPDGFNKLSAGTKESISKTMKLERGEVVTWAMIRNMHWRLEGMAIVSQARKAAMKAMAASVDHMAGANLPHQHKGAVTASDDAGDTVGVAAKLNEFFYASIDKQKTTRREAAEELKARGSYAQEANEEMVNDISDIGKPVAGHPNVLALRGSQVMGLLKRSKILTPDQITVFSKLLSKRENNRTKDTVYYFGVSEDLEAVRDELYADVEEKPYVGRIQMGQAHPGPNIVFIENQSPETVLHEMLHIHTLHILDNHFANPEASPEYVREAVKNLQMLVQEALKIDPAGVLGVNKLTGGSAIEVFQAQLRANAKNPAVQISELISYSLTNQDLISLGQRKKVYGPLMQVIYKGLNFFKKLLGITSHPGSTLWSNIRFNTEVLTATPLENEAEISAQTTQVANMAYGPMTRIDRIEQQYLDKLMNHIKANKPTASGTVGVNKKAYAAEITAKRLESNRVAQLATASGFTMNARELSAFEAVHRTMTSGMVLDAGLLRQVNKLYTHVLRGLTAQGLLDAIGNTSPTTAELSVAQDQIDFLHAPGAIRTAAGRTDLLATFMGLAEADSGFREALMKMPAPKGQDFEWNSVDSWLTNLGEMAMNLLINLSISRKRKSFSVGLQLDKLAESLSQIQQENRIMALAQVIQNPINKANDLGARYLDKGAKQADAWLSKRVLTSKNKVLQLAAGAAQQVTALGSKDLTLEKGEALTSILNANDGWATARDLLKDLRGMTPSNAPLLRMVNVVKSVIDALRQNYREKVPDELASRFGRKISSEEWASAHTGIGMSDILSLGSEEALEVIRDPSVLSTKIQDEETIIRNLAGPRYAARYFDKVKALSRYMITREVTSWNLLRSGFAIANLVGEHNGNQITISNLATEDLIDAINRLTSLRAYELVDQVDKDRLKLLADTEAEGFETLVRMHRTVRQAELERTGSGRTNFAAEYNGWKGYTPSVRQDGSSVIIGEDDDHDTLILRGYVRLGPYSNDRREGNTVKRSYYQTSVGGLNGFNQGVAQTVHESYQGVDAKTGVTVSGDTDGTLRGSKAERIAKATELNAGKNDNKPAGTYLLPLFNSQGKVVGYERPLEPAKLEGLKKDKHLGRMLGVWLGRILEEDSADKFNTELVKTAHDIWQKDVGTIREKEYVNVADPKLKDRVIKDAWDTLGWKIKSEAEGIFGKEDLFMVRRDMVDDMIGSRSSGITDMWTGISRWKPGFQDGVKDFATLMMGKNAYKWLSQAEDVIQSGVSLAKSTIIVRSVVVAMQNLSGNMLQLTLNGLTVPQIVKGSREKFIEITEYVKNEERINALNTDYAVLIEKSPSEARKVKAQIAALQDANANMTIAPLIKAGEFSTISENLTEADVSIRENRFFDYIEGLTDRLPEWASGVTKNVLITKDSAVFRGLNRMVQYGDFVAKAVLYDHLMENGKTQQEALDVILEQFVQYNRNPGRTRDGLEKLGLLWFMSYKLRILKVALANFQERPLSFLGGTFGMAPTLGLESPASGSIVGSVISGDFNYATGWDMGLNSWTLHPVLGLAD